VRVVALLAAFLLTAGGCGGGEGRRGSVRSYIEDVDATQAQLRTPLADVTQALRGFSARPKQLRRLQPRLARGEQTMRALERRLARLRPPREANRLHRLVLRFVGSEALLVGELQRLAVFLPRFEARMRSLGLADRQLATTLGAAQTADAQAAALDRYRAALLRRGRDLRRVKPPRVLAATYDAQIATVARVRAGAAALARALRDAPAALSQAIRRFRAASRSATSLAVQRGQIAAVKSYNRRLDRLAMLDTQVGRERARLERTLR
jgi:hypothetical protein